MKRVKIDHPDAKEIFINAIHDNQVIAYPTDTIYGLGTAMNNDEGIERINLMKMREQPMSIALGSFNVIKNRIIANENAMIEICLLYTSPSPRDRQKYRMPSSA